MRPNLFIVGAMKCGTTILSDFLGVHPQISVARGKEVHYFSLHEERGEEWYMEHFQASEDLRYAVDASPTYFDTSNTNLIAKKIKAFNPGAKIIIMIRDPVERLISHYNHLQKINKFTSLQNVPIWVFLERDWLSALTQHDEPSFLLHQMFDFSAYYRKMLYFASVFGRDNVMVIDNGELRSYGSAVMEAVFNFLQVEPIASPVFSEQRYLGGTDHSVISGYQLSLLAGLFREDYLRSLSYNGVTRTGITDSRSKEISTDLHKYIDALPHEG